MFVLAALCIAQGAVAQQVDTTLWSFGPGGRVLAIAATPDRIYLGGSFNYIGPPTGGGVPFDRHTWVAQPQNPRVAGHVRTVLADGAGGWFIGGAFSHVGSVPRRNLAHVLADGSVASWRPDPDNEVWALALNESTLYVGGDFDSICGVPRLRLAAVALNSSEPLPWRCDVDGRVSALLASDTSLYAGGMFTKVATAERSYVAAIDLGSGRVLPWSIQLDDRVTALASKDTTLYVGGYFAYANGQARLGILSAGTVSGALHPWNPQLQRTPVTTDDGGPHVSALLVVGDSLIVGGSFSEIGGAVRHGLAKLDLENGSASPWDARPDRATRYGPDIWSFVRSGDSLYVAGAFSSIAGVATADAIFTACLSLTNGELLGWGARSNDFIFSMALQGEAIYFGGWFTSIGNEWVRRQGLAAIDQHSGRVTDWDPAPDGPIRTILVHGGHVYVGGDFTFLQGQWHPFVAQLNRDTGAPTAWDPEPDQNVWTLQPFGSSVLVGGRFTTICGQPQPALAAVDTLSPLLSSWRPSTDKYSEIYCSTISDSIIYVGGDFISMGGIPRASLASFDLRTAGMTDWDPGTDGVILGMCTLNSVVYFGGIFNQVGGQPRTDVAAADSRGTVTPWAPNVYGPPGTRVYSMAASDSTVFVGGYLSGFGGTSREWFGALDPTTGAVRPGYPPVDGPVSALTTLGPDLYVGGGFGTVGAWPQACFAAIRGQRKDDAFAPIGIGDLRCAPNPMHDRGTFRYSLAGPATVRLMVFDILGRIVARTMPLTRQTAGVHSVQIATSGWRPGCYLARLETGSTTTTRRFVVVR